RRNERRLDRLQLGLRKAGHQARLACVPVIERITGESTTRDGNRPAAESDTRVCLNGDLHHTAPLGELQPGELIAAEACGPVGPERAVRRTSDGIFGDPDPRGEEARDKVGTIGLRRARSDDHATRLYLAKSLEVR